MSRFTDKIRGRVEDAAASHADRDLERRGAQKRDIPGGSAYVMPRPQATSWRPGDDQKRR
jgi:hypothetical protein